MTKWAPAPVSTQGLSIEREVHRRWRTVVTHYGQRDISNKGIYKISLQTVRTTLSHLRNETRITWQSREVSLAGGVKIELLILFSIEGSYANKPDSAWAQISCKQVMCGEKKTSVWFQEKETCGVAQLSQTRSRAVEVKSGKEAMSANMDHTVAFGFVELSCCCSVVAPFAVTREEKWRKQPSHPGDDLYRAVTAVFRLRQIRGLYQDRRPCGRPLAPSQKSHSNNSAQIYAGCPLIGCQSGGHIHKHLVLVFSLHTTKNWIKNW